MLSPNRPYQELNMNQTNMNQKNTICSQKDFYNSTIFGLEIKYIFLLPEVRSNFIPSTQGGEISFAKESNYVNFEWKNLLLEATPQLGIFTFSCRLYRNGCISFFYEEIPPKKSINATTTEIQIHLGGSNKCRI